MYKLYGHKGSGSAAIEMALKAVGEEYEVVDVASWEPATPIHELAGVNALTQIPTLVLPDNTVLTESAAILLQLGDAFPAAGILTTEPGLRAKTVQGLLYIAANCYPAVGIVDFPERWTAANNISELENIKIGTRQRLDYLWEVFADTFSGSPYLSGLQPGVLDFYTVNICRMFSAYKQLQRTRPAFYELLQTIERVPIVSGVVARHWPA